MNDLFETMVEYIQDSSKSVLVCGRESAELVKQLEKVSGVNYTLIDSEEQAATFVENMSTDSFAVCRRSVDSATDMFDIVGRVADNKLIGIISKSRRK